MRLSVTSAGCLTDGLIVGAVEQAVVLVDWAVHAMRITLRHETAVLLNDCVAPTDVDMDELVGSDVHRSAGRGGSNLRHLVEERFRCSVALSELGVMW